jgi:hypothetical protein
MFLPASPIQVTINSLASIRLNRRPNSPAVASARNDFPLPRAVKKNPVSSDAVLAVPLASDAALNQLADKLLFLIQAADVREASLWHQRHVLLSSFAPFASW